MKVNQFHLTYCSNIHPGETWEEVRHNLARFLPPIRRRLGFKTSFGIGLRLSAQAAETLEKPKHLDDFKHFLEEHDAYVFTINGFPFGAFHRTRVKEAVYLPDWRDEARLHYTNRLARILSALLPSEEGLEGSVSTVPGGFKTEIRSKDDVRQMAGLLLRHAALLRELKEQTGKTITLALEPEPCCYLETVDEALDFFESLLGDEIARRHIGICYDACHMAVEFEDPDDALTKLRSRGIKICKFQISSALQLQFLAGDGQAQAKLLPFVEDTYLHQVVEKSGGRILRYRDLPEALAAEARGKGSRQKKEWRVHFHVPVFLRDMTNFGTTQDHLISLLERLKQNPICPYLEVETYTWDVLPEQYKIFDTATAIARELAWVRDRIKQ